MPSYNPGLDKNRMVRVLTYLLIATLLLLPAVPAFADDVSVRGYFRSDGTYVQPYMRSAPDFSYNNNSGSGFGEYNSGLGTTQPRSRSR